MKSLIMIKCCLCSERHAQEIELPEGWRIRYKDIEEENAFCPKHSLVSEWVDAQCPGCVGSWKDCNLWRDFAYENRALSPEDLNAIRNGICPRRTNGSLLLDADGIQDINLSHSATTKSGEVLAQSIIDYWNKCELGLPPIGF